MSKFWLGGNGNRTLATTNFLQSIDFARIPETSRVYAIGDIHGMAMDLRRLLTKINEDRLGHEYETYLVFLGDYIDRGPDSNLVIETLHALMTDPIRTQTCVFLKGNHEQMLLNFISNPAKFGAFWLRNGGDATLTSYGVHSPRRPSTKQLAYLRDELVARLPVEHRRFLNQLTLKFTLGDYFFCHAGVKAGQSLDEQSDETLLWTREILDESGGPQEKIIVHGHHPVAAPEIGQYHINVDTGAYATRCLTALKLHGASREFISTQMHDRLKDSS